MSKIDKTEAARRQLEAAIDMFFSQSDPIVTYSVAYSAFKVLLDIYPHHQQDGFSKQIDDVIGIEGWRKLSGVANFLKHADRDYDAVLNDLDAMRPMGVIGLGTMLYRRVTGNFTRKMMAFDYWAEESGYEELGIVEIDENVERAAAHKALRDSIRALPLQERMLVAQHQYQSFLKNVDRAEEQVTAFQAAGMSFTEAMDVFAKRGPER